MDFKKKLKLFTINFLKSCLQYLGVQTQEREGVFVIIRSPTNRNRVLLVFDGKKWSLPGGGIKQGEFAPNGAAREGLDETGLKIEMTKLVGHFSFRIKYGFQVLFESKVLSGQIERDGNNKDIAKCDFFWINGLPKNMYDAQRGMVGWAEYSRINDVKEPLYGHPDKPPLEEFRS